MDFHSKTHTDASGTVAEIGTVTHDGHTISATGAYVSDTHLTAYLGKHNKLTMWNGEEIGTYTVTRTWRTPRSFVSSTMSQVYARLTDGRTYTGRSAGEGMVFHGKRVAREK